MENPVERMRAMVHSLAESLDPSAHTLLPASRGLEVIVDKQFEQQVLQYRWYALVSRGGHIHAVTDIDAKRISLQRYVLTLADPTRSFDQVNQVSFVNKVSLDCRLSNLADRVGRQAVMRNRRPKRNTTSQYKGVSKAATRTEQVKWKAQIKADTKQLYLGHFEDEKWAAMVYDAAAYLLFEGAAFYNFPDLCPDLAALEVATAKIARDRSRKKRMAQTQ